MTRYERHKTFIKLDLSFFDASEKTEKATPKRRAKARERGQVAMSQEVKTALLLISVFFALRIFAGGMYNGMTAVFSRSLANVASFDRFFSTPAMAGMISGLLARAVLIAAPVLAVAFAVGFASSLAQVGWKVTLKPLMPKFSKLNPIKGFKRIVSVDSLLQLFKSLAKLIAIIIVLYSIIQGQIHKIPGLMSLSLEQSAGYIAGLTATMGIGVGAAYLLIAALDFTYTRFKHAKDLRMTKQEIKEEYKEMEGNPQIKQKIRRRMMEISMRRMMDSVPGADVIITNPAHYAVALKYDSAVSPAPLVVAKGADFMAQRIKEKARENKVEIVENAPLARTLYNSVKLGAEVPPELYQAVAEILAFVYRIKNKT